jgi:hypothetical protein
VPDELQKLAAAAKNEDAPARNPDGSPKVSDPLAATVRAATSPFPQEALPDADRALPRLEMKEPEPAPQGTVSQVPPSASNIEPEAEIPLPTARSNRSLWLVVIGLGAGALSFLAVPFIRNLISQPPAPETPPPLATANATETATVASVPPSAVDPAAPTSSSGSESPTETNPAASAPVAAVSAEVPASAPAPSAPPTSADEPDEAALATLEKGTGFLVVASSLQTNVYLYGILAGQTNQRLVSKCGPRFIRLGTSPGVWQTQGSVSVVKCGGFTRVQMNP